MSRRISETGANTKLANVEIYTSPFCGYCHRAKKLLSDKNVAFTEIDVMMDPAEKRTMIARANGASTVPQIFIGDTHVGGCDDLYALEAAQKLDPLLEEKGAR
jgi:glutaredoxin 3